MYSSTLNYVSYWDSIGPKKQPPPSLICCYPSWKGRLSNPTTTTPLPMGHQHCRHRSYYSTVAMPSRFHHSISSSSSSFILKFQWYKLNHSPSRLFHHQTFYKTSSCLWSIPKTVVSTKLLLGSSIRRTIITTTTSSSTLNPKSSTTPNNSSSRWVRIAKVIRYVRIPALVISVYALGYQQGVIDCVKEPVELQRQILHGILKSTGCQEDEDQILIIPETDIQRRWHSVHALRHHQVAAVGHTIVSTARQYIRNELEQAMEKVRRTLPDDADDAQQVAAFLRDDQVVFWDQARLRLEGESATPQPWQYVIVPSSSPNAFVTEILPRKFFITTSMLERIATSPDELAVVLAHETAHLILGHVSSTNKVETALRTIEVLLLSMDPTAGVLSVFVMGLLFAIRKMITAAHSRENEMQADDLGLVLAGKACYDIIRGVQVMYKMHQADGAAAAVLVPSSATSADTKIVRQPSTSQATPDLLPAPIGTPAILRLMDTHPPSLERYQRMKEQAEHAHHPECASLTTKLWNAMWSATTATTRNPTAKEQ